MDSKDIRNLQEAYNSVYELDEVRGGGRIDPVSDMSGIGERGARSPKDAGLLMSPLDRAKARANALTKKGNTKQANQINSRFVKPTERAVNRSLLAATNAKHAEKTRLMKSNEQVDLYDLVLSHLLDEGYADTNENALVIMTNMSEEWRESILLDEMQGIRNPRVKQTRGELDAAKKIMRKNAQQAGTDALIGKLKRASAPPEPPTDDPAGNNSTPRGGGVKQMLNPENKPPRRREVTPYVPPEGEGTLAARTANIRPFGTVKPPFVPPPKPVRR